MKKRWRQAGSRPALQRSKKRAKTSQKLGSKPQHRSREWNGILDVV